MAKRSKQGKTSDPASIADDLPARGRSDQGQILRFAISPTAGADLLDSAFIRRLAIDERETAEITTYYDTAEGALNKYGLLLGVSESDSGNVQVLELASSHPKAGMAPGPPILPVDGRAPDLATVAQLAGIACPALQAEELEILLAIRLTRRRLLVKWQGSLFRIAFDHGGYLDATQGHVLAPLSEIVLQQGTGDPEDLYSLALALNDHTNWRQIGLSRGECGLSALASPLRPQRRKARSPQIEAKESGRAAFGKIMSESLAQFLANDPTTIGDTAEAVHQSRVAIRRLRAGLRAFKSVLPDRERQAFNADFRWLQQSLGASRDWHVFQTETLPAIAGLTEDQRAKLNALACRHQEDGLKRAIGALAGRRAARLLLRFQLWLHTLEHPDSALEQPVKKMAVKLVRKCYQRLAAAGPLNSRRPMTEIHAIRIRGKQLRYALEFFASLPALAPYLPASPALKALQTHLGNANDAAVTLKLLSGDTRAPVSAGSRLAVETWAAARMIDCIEEARPAMTRIAEIFGK